MMTTCTPLCFSQYWTLSQSLDSGGITGPSLENRASPGNLFGPAYGRSVVRPYVPSLLPLPALYTPSSEHHPPPVLPLRRLGFCRAEVHAALGAEGH